MGVAKLKAVMVGQSCKTYLQPCWVIKNKKIVGDCADTLNIPAVLERTRKGAKKRYETRNIYKIKVTIEEV